MSHSEKTKRRISEGVCRAYARKGIAAESHKTELNCENCGKRFRANRSKRVTCSRECTRALNPIPSVVYDMEYIKDRVKVNAKGCWIWQRSTAEGYGQFVIPGKDGIPDKSFRAHRFAYELRYGKLKKGLVVRHYKCRNKRCCNPEHMKSGTNLDNAHDSLRQIRAAGRRRRGLPSRNRIPITIDGKDYPSISHATKALGISWKTAKRLSM